MSGYQSPHADDSPAETAHMTHLARASRSAVEHQYKQFALNAMRRGDFDTAVLHLEMCVEHMEQFDRDTPWIPKEAPPLRPDAALMGNAEGDRAALADARRIATKWNHEGRVS